MTGEPKGLDPRTIGMTKRDQQMMGIDAEQYANRVAPKTGPPTPTTPVPVEVATIDESSAQEANSPEVVQEPAVVAPTPEEQAQKENREQIDAKIQEITLFCARNKENLEQAGRVINRLRSVAEQVSPREVYARQLDRIREEYLDRIRFSIGPALDRNGEIAQTRTHFDQSQDFADRVLEQKTTELRQVISRIDQTIEEVMPEINRIRRITEEYARGNLEIDHPIIQIGRGLRQLQETIEPLKKI